MKNLHKISAQEYLQKTIHSQEPDLELLPIFKIHFSRLLDPSIVSIRLSKEGVEINRHTEKNVDEYEFGIALTEEKYGHFYSKNDLSSKEIFEGILYDKDPDKYQLLPYVIQDMDASIIQDYQLFGDFKFAYQLIKDRRYTQNLTDELSEKLDQLHQSVEESIDISHTFRSYLIVECVNKVISKLKNEVAENEKFASLYDELVYEYQNIDTFNHPNELYQFCEEVFHEFSDTKKKAIEYSLADMKRIDVREQEGHYDSYIYNQGRNYEETFISEVLFEVNHYIYQSS